MWDKNEYNWNKGCDGCGWWKRNKTGDEKGGELHIFVAEKKMDNDNCTAERQKVTTGTGITR